MAEKKSGGRGGSSSNGVEFERPILELEQKIAELENLAAATGMDLGGEIQPLRERCRVLVEDTFTHLSPWQKVAVARHPQRPIFSDYVAGMLDDFVELHGDRTFSDDRAIVAGFGRLAGRRILVLGHQKGRGVKEKVACNFGSAHPEGYRKALVKMQLAEKFSLPIVTLIDTPGAYPGIGAEERGQAQAIARNIFEMSRLRVPIVCVVTGEGGSGGALGIGLGDKLVILEHAYYSVISPEGCAAILWKSGEMAPTAAAALKLTGTDLLKLGIVDEVVPEPQGGAHRDVRKMTNTLKDRLIAYLNELAAIPIDRLIARRYERVRRLGA
jgi:acetyl-CoA carboxylase carboxyl transferase subunit alpha